MSSLLCTVVLTYLLNKISFPWTSAVSGLQASSHRLMNTIWKLKNNKLVRFGDLGYRGYPEGDEYCPAAYILVPSNCYGYPFGETRMFFKQKFHCMFLK